IIATSAAAMSRFALDGSVSFDTATVLFVGSAVGAVGGARVAGRIPNYWLARGFVALLVASIMRLTLGGGGGDGADPLVTGFAEPASLIAVGLFAGLLSATLGIGGGAIFVPSIVALLGFEQQVAQGTSLAVILPTVIIGSAVHARAGRVNWSIAIPAGVGGIVGGIAGAQIALGLPEATLRRMFAAFLVLVALRMLSRTRAPAAETSS
ncbi:MAG: sulfite exporter TauE/SafE family protein, partial [Acidimicrobiia bacterium]